MNQILLSCSSLFKVDFPISNCDLISKVGLSEIFPHAWNFGKQCLQWNTFLNSSTLGIFYDQRTLSDKSMWRNCLVDQVSSRWRDEKGNSCFDFTFLSFKGLIEKLIIKFENGEWRTMAEVWNHFSSWDSSIKLLKKYNSVIHSMCWGK